MWKKKLHLKKKVQVYQKPSDLHDSLWKNTKSSAQSRQWEHKVVLLGRQGYFLVVGYNLQIGILRFFFSFIMAFVNKMCTSTNGRKIMVLK